MRLLMGWASSSASARSTERREGPTARRGIGRIAGVATTAAAAVAAMLATTVLPGALPPASASVSWTSPVATDGLAKGFPVSFDDGNVKLRLCTSGPQCMVLPGIPEYFWYGAKAVGGGPGDPNKNLKLYLAGLEGTYLNTPLKIPAVAVPGDEVGFSRLRFRIVNLVVGATYTVTHPYGVNTFVATAAVGGGHGGGTNAGEINQTIDLGCGLAVPCNDWNSVGAGFLGDFTPHPASFLRQANAPAGWLGDILVPGPVTGAPSGTNAVIVEGPDAGGPGINRLEVTDFAVQGQILTAGASSTPDLVSASDTGSSSTDNITNATQPTFTGTTDGFAGTEVQVNLLVDGATTPAVSTTTVDGSYTATLTDALLPGLHSVVAASAGLRSSPLEFTVKTAASVVTLGSGPPDNSADPTFTFVSDDPAATFECQLLPAVSTFTPCASGQTFPEQTDGDHTFSVRATDVAGNVGDLASLRWRIDTLAPIVTLGSRPSDNTAQWTPTFTFTSDDPATTFECRLLPTIATFAPCASPATFVAQTDGKQTFNVRATDPAGNLSDPTSFSWRIDTVAPAVRTRTPIAGAVSVGQAGNLTTGFTENVSGVGGSTYTLRKTSTRAAVAAAVSYNATTHVATLNPKATLAPATRYTATLTSGIKDAAGNAMKASSWSFTTGPRPTVTRKSPAPNVLRVSRTANVTASFSEKVTGVSRSAFILTKASTGRVVSTTISYSSRTRVATLNPRSALAANTRYTATLSSLIMDPEGNRIITTSWRFTTRR